MKILIIGQGLAGSVLAHQLFFTHQIKDFTIVDNGHYNATKVSSGIMNPVTGRRIVKTWQCETLFPLAVDFYNKIGTELNANFIEEKEIIRFFESTKEYNDFTIKSAEKAYKKYIKEEQNPKEAQLIDNNFGAGKIAGAYVINTSLFLEKSKQFFIENNNFIENNFSFNENFKVSENEIIWNNEKYDKVIFAEGYKAVENPYFGYLPFRPAKGEVYIAKIEQLPQERMIKKGIFFMPLGNHTFWVGSTYVNNDLSLEASEKGISILNEKIEKAIGNLAFSIERIDIGIRPATKDRRPFLGVHSKHKNVFIFNGFGTKGVSLSPWASEQFCDFLLNNETLNEEIDVKRFVKS